MEKLNDQRVVNTTDRNDIEQILNMISHNIRKPISTTLGLIKIIETETDFKTGDKEFFKMIGYLKSNVEELDLFTREMNELFSRFSIK